MIHRVCGLFLLCATSVFAPTNADAFQPQERFLAMVSDGARLKSDKIVNWFEQKSNPTLANHAIFDAKRPVRWIIDQAAAQGTEPDAMLEFFGGDRLPARVLQYIRSAPDSFENLGECLIVKPTVAIDLPKQPTSQYIRVSMQWLRRIVFDNRLGTQPRYQPGTLFLMNGSQIQYKAARWRKGGLAILTNDGSHSYSLRQIAELHFPLRNMWEVWFEQR